MAEQFRMYFIKHKRIYQKYLVVLFACASIFIAQEALAVEVHQISSDPQQMLDYQTMQKSTSNFYSSTNPAFSIPNFLYGEPLLKPQPDESYELMIDRFFRIYPDVFQNITIADFRVEIEQPKGRSITQVHLFQTYQRIPVFGRNRVVKRELTHDSDMLS